MLWTPASSDWGWIIALVVVAFALLRSIPYFWQHSRRDRWPVVQARIQKGSLGWVSFGKSSSYAAFLGYAFVFQGVRYAGIFALYGAENVVDEVNKTLDGEQIEIYCKPSDPGVSFLVAELDSRFKGLASTQDLDVLSQAPAFDIEDAIRSAALPASKRN